MTAKPAQESATHVANAVAESVQYQGRKASRQGSEQRRQQILDAAMRIIVRDGVRGVRHRAVAAEAGVPLSATTYYFKDIEDLLTDTFAQYVERSAAYMAKLWINNEGLLREMVVSGDGSPESRSQLADDIARLMADAGLIVISAFISPFRADRDAARALFAEGEFIEVYVNASLGKCEQRDPKGLYQAALEGRIKDFTGLDSPYEAPLQADALPGIKELNSTSRADGADIFIQFKDWDRDIDITASEARDRIDAARLAGRDRMAGPAGWHELGWHLHRRKHRHDVRQRHARTAAHGAGHQGKHQQVQGFHR